MPRNAERYLFDMYDACTRVQSYTAGLDLDSYSSAQLTRDAVERCLEIVGEALRQLLQHHPSLNAVFPEAREIIGLRNILAQEYGDVEDDRVWLVVVDKVPGLLSRVSEELSRQEAPKESK